VPAAPDADVFICHAREDKDLVRPLASALAAKELKVWYDEFVLKPGDSLREKIDSGLSGCRYAMVVVSPSFFGKRWAQWELNGIVQRHLAAPSPLLIPLWHNVTSEMVARHSPSLADILAIRSSIGVERIADEVAALIGPPTEEPSRLAAHVDYDEAQLASIVAALHKHACRQLGLDQERLEMRCRVVSEPNTQHREDGLTDWVARQGRALVLPWRGEMDSAMYRPGSQPVRSIFVFPIFAEEPAGKTTVGVASLDSSEPGIFKQHGDFLNEFVNLCQGILGAVVRPRIAGDKERPA